MNIAPSLRAIPWFFGLVSDLIAMIASNDLLLFIVAFAIVSGVVGLVIKIIDIFGVRGRK